MKIKILKIKSNSQNNNESLQSAGNLKGSSETTRQLSKAVPQWFPAWLAGTFAIDGNFDIRKIDGKLKLKAIRVKLHVRDVRILTKIQNQVHFGKIYHTKNKPYCTYKVSTRNEMIVLLNSINGLIRLKRV